MGEVGREAASQSVASRFSRIMNATTSPLGQIVDPPIVAVATGVLLIAFLAALRSDASPEITRALGALAATPFLLAVLCSLALIGARGKVIDFLAKLPFPVENMNAVLNGLGEGLEIEFEGEPPSAKDLNEALDHVSPDAFVTDELADQKVVVVRVGVVDSKRNPAKTNYQRWRRVVRIVEEVLVPLHDKRPIARVRVK